MPDDKDGYRVGAGRPPLHTRFQKGQSGDPGGRSKKSLQTLMADALNQPVSVTVDGRRRKITKRGAVVHQLVNKSASADLRATKMLIDMIEGGRTEGRRDLRAAPKPPRPGPADKEVIEVFIPRLRRQILAEFAAEQTAESGEGGVVISDAAGLGLD